VDAEHLYRGRNVYDINGPARSGAAGFIVTAGKPRGAEAALAAGLSVATTGIALVTIHTGKARAAIPAAPGAAAFLVLPATRHADVIHRA